MAKTNRIAIRVDDELRDRLQELADAQDRSLSYYIEKVLRDHIASLAKRR